MSDAPENPDQYLEPTLNLFDQLGAILDHSDTSIDQKLESIVETLDDLNTQLLKAVSKFSADEIEEAFDKFLTPRENDEKVQLQNLLIAIACAAEFKRRADQIGLTALEYARRIRVRRELDNL
ncbi:MAG: hypothetical protein OXF79_21390 [Chloroflexi bacterium]|nr:hypothetical protein [Chloroflexota bacterium]